MTASPFCEHKKLRTSCAACKAGAIPPPTPDVTPFVTADEREAKEAKRTAREAKPASPGNERETKTPRPTGPGKPLMPVRTKKKGISADEAASATAWWVKK